MSEIANEHVSNFIGLDLGPAGQFTGLAVVEQRGTLNDYGLIDGRAYAVRHLHRFPPGTPYSTIVAEAQRVLAELPAANRTVVVDQTGVGQKVFRTIRDELSKFCVRGVTVTAGSNAAADGRGGWIVSRTDLVGAMQILLQERRLKIAPTLPLAPTLAGELHQFQARAVSLAADASLEWRERPHDDLVLAVAIAVWLAERSSGFIFRVI